MQIDISQHETGPIKVKRHSLRWRMKIYLLCVKTFLFPKFQQNRIDRFSSSIDIVIPQKISRKDVILVACDEVYFWDYALPFVKSLSMIDDTFFVHLHLMRPTDKIIDRVNYLNNIFDNTHLSWSCDKLTGVDVPTQMNIYYNCSRFIVADVLLSKDVDRLLILDVDTIARSSPWTKLEAVKTLGALSFRRRARKPWHKILAGTVYYKNSPEIRRFSRQFASALLNTLSENPKYHIDQIIPYYLLKIGSLRYTSIFSDVPSDLMSLNYEQSSSLWMAKGREKYGEKFQREVGKIIDANVSISTDKESSIVENA